jgi:uncharacterized protein
MTRQVATRSAVGWPYGSLNLGELRRSGWRPSPFREFVLKVHQRCNLACDYCYVYELADQSWRERPIVMTPEVEHAAATRIGEHVRAHSLSRIGVVLHGGEPLLAGTESLLRLIADVRAAVPADCAVAFTMQTNGLLLDPPTVEALRAAGVRVGVSVDGPAGDHDRHRRRRNGGGSHDATMRAIDLLDEDTFGGLLCVIDPASDPLTCYEALLEHRPPAIDFLLPHKNWSKPHTGTPYGNWLVSVFDRWYSAPRRETRIRLFEEIMSLALGGRGRSDQVGLSPVGVVVIETDGAIEQVDSLKSAYEGAAATGLSVLIDPFDKALEHPGIVARQIGRAALGAQCRACEIQSVCGGGHYAHRYRERAGFRNPSVYCADLQRLIVHIGKRLNADLND